MTTTPPEAPTGPRTTRDEVRQLGRLRRSRSDKKIAGVAGGISRHLDIDPLVTRVALVVLVFFGGAGLIIYGAVWLLVPLEGRSRATVPLDDRSRAGALVVVGVLAVLSLLGDSLGSWSFPWPLFVASIVVVSVLLLRGRNDEVAAPEPAYEEASSPPDPGAYPPPAPPTAYVAPRPARGPRRPGPVLFWYTLALIAIGGGVLASIDLSGVDVVTSAYPGLALVTSGVMLVVGSVWGRPGGLIALGLVSALGTAGALAAADLDVGRLERTPAASSELLDSYDLDVGEIVIDLTEVRDLDELAGRTLELDVDLGRIEVVVPDGLTVTAEATLRGGGDTTVFGTDNQEGTYVGILTAPPGSPELSIDASVGLGEIEIIHEGDS